MTPREIYDALRYQLAPVGVTTMGPCANGCRCNARGGNTCASCLAYKLLGAGYLNALELHATLKASKHAILEAEQWLQAREAIDAAMREGA